MNSLTQSYLIPRIYSAFSYHQRTLVDTILETSLILSCKKCELIVTRTHLLNQCPVGKPLMRSVSYTVILYYMELFFFYKCVCNLKFFLNCHALHQP